MVCGFVFAQLLHTVRTLLCSFLSFGKFFDRLQNGFCRFMYLAQHLVYTYKTIIMKNALLLITISLLAINVNAQSPATFTLVNTPCDSNGVIAVSYSGSGPFEVIWMGGTTAEQEVHTG